MGVSLQVAVIAVLLIFSSETEIWLKPVGHVTEIVYVPNDFRLTKTLPSSSRRSPHPEIAPGFSEPPLAQPDALRTQVMPGGFDIPAGPPATGFSGKRPAASDGWDTHTGSGRGFLPGGPATSANVFEGPGTGRGGPTPHSRQEPDEPAELLPGASPEYTPEAKTSGITGDVWLEVELRSSGEVHVLRILSQPLGYRLEEVAVRAANRYRCKPARKGGRTITVVGQIKVAFTLSS